MRSVSLSSSPIGLATLALRRHYNVRKYQQLYEHDCAGVFPCNAIDYGNQYGDYLGLVSHGGVSHPVWTDSRDNQTAAPGCRTDLLMEAVFTATVQQRVRALKEQGD